MTGLLGYSENDTNRARGGACFALRNSNYSSPGFNLSLGNSSGYEFNQPLQLSGLLEAGTYFLEVYAYTDVDLYSYYADTSADASAYYDFSLSITEGTPSEVPVPAAAWLFGSALMGLVGCKRKK